MSTKIESLKIPFHEPLNPAPGFSSEQGACCSPGAWGTGVLCSGVRSIPRSAEVGGDGSSDSNCLKASGESESLDWKQGSGAIPDVSDTVGDC